MDTHSQMQDDLRKADILADIFRLLGDESRLKIVLFCRQRSVSVSDIADGVGLSPSLVSHHLRLLRTARIMRTERDGRRVFYTVSDSHVDHMLQDMLEHTQCNVVDPD
jgi:DNA-binding transcriptional ArsR family regulator